MRSFAQHIGSKRTNNLADTAFKLMASRGVDPLRFVEWYATEGILLKEEELPNQAAGWLQQELLLVEAAPETFLGRMARGATSMLGHIPGKLVRGVTGLGHQIGDIAQGVWHGGGDAMQQFGHDYDTAMGEKGLQKSSQCKTGYYDMNTGHCVAVDAQGKPQAGQFVDRLTGQPLPPQQAQQPGPMKGQPGAGGPGGNQPQQQGAVDQNLQGQINQAHQALTALSKNMPQDLQQNNAFVMALHQMIAILAKAPPAPAPAAAAPVVSHYDPQLNTPFLQHVIVETKCRQVVDCLVEHGHDPRAFVQWYKEEGRHMSPEVFEGHVGDFFGNMWGGIKGALGGQGWTAGWNQAVQNRQAGVKQTAVQALMALQQQAQALQGYGPDFMKHMQTVMQALGASTTPDEAPEEEGGDDQAGAGDDKAVDQQQEAPPDAPLTPDKIQMVKDRFQASGIDVTKLSDEDLQKYGKEILATTRQNGQRTAKIEEIIAKIKGTSGTSPSPPPVPVPQEVTDGLKQALSGAGVDPNGVKPEDLEAHGRELMGIQDPTQRTAKMQEIIAKIKNPPAQPAAPPEEDPHQTHGNADHYSPRGPRLTEEQEFFKSILGQTSKKNRPKSWFS